MGGGGYFFLKGQVHKKVTFRESILTITVNTFVVKTISNRNKSYFTTLFSDLYTIAYAVASAGKNHKKMVRPNEKYSTHN